MDYRSSRILRRPRRLQRIQTRSNPDGLARRIPGPPRLANPTFGTQAESNKIWHNLFAVGRPHHEEHPFPPSLRILHPAELSFTVSDAATTASPNSASASSRHPATPPHSSHPHLPASAI